MDGGEGTSKVALDLADKLLRIEVQFGLTPAARCRIQAPPIQDKREKKARFFQDKKRKRA